jgi:TPP-dependent pyruvate/acetoin dehydrogenase alpha subunit
VREHRKRDPVPRFEQTLLRAGVITEQGLAALKADVLRDVNAATYAAEALPLPDASTLYGNVYEGAHEPWR